MTETKTKTFKKSEIKESVVLFSGTITRPASDSELKINKKIPKTEK